MSLTPGTPGIAGLSELRPTVAFDAPLETSVAVPSGGDLPEALPLPPAAEIEAPPTPIVAPPTPAPSTPPRIVALSATPPAATATPLPLAVFPPTSTPQPAPTATSTRIPPPPAPPAAPVSLSGLEQQLFAAHNVQRTNGGRAALATDATLVQVARQRAADMASKGYFSHTSPSGETAFTLLSRAGYRFAMAGENIARNNYPESQSAGVAMTGFMNSPSHKENVMEPRFTLVGIGAVVGADGMKYYAVVFSGQ